MSAQAHADIELHQEKILELEFNYARETAAQAQNDRTTVFNLYLIVVGGVGSLLLALPAIAPDEATLPPEALSILFALLGVIGLLTLLKLVRLRQAWQDSALTMNRIKDYYVEQFPDLNSVLRWRTKTLPAPGKLWSITFILSLMVSLISSVAMAGAAHLSRIRAGTPGLAIDGVAFAFWFVLQAIVYFYQLGWGNPREITPPMRETEEKK